MENRKIVDYLVIEIDLGNHVFNRYGYGRSFKFAKDCTRKAQGKNYQSVGEEVMKFIRQGWQPLGGAVPIDNGRFYSQTLVKYSTE